MKNDILQYFLRGFWFTVGAVAALSLIAIVAPLIGEIMG